ncbi:MAG TPA: hypothetical protein VG406_11605 [Isosphaeraceae bacterium]|jgi:hypothetical protein|nr:hypothetical protein [Isosphaeraceae bacterium]
MRLSLNSLLRLIAFTGLGACAAAVGLGRLAPREPSFRRLEPAPFLDLEGARPRPMPASGPLFDLGTGRAVEMPMPAGERLELRAVSPWRDERGSLQVVGRWTAVAGTATDSTLRDAGLARFRFPGGEPLDRLSTGVLPSGAPCWFPDTTARVLFAAGDGQLYRLNFDGRPEAGEDDRRPVPIAWRTEPAAPVVLADPCWRADAALGGHALVALARPAESADAHRPAPARLHWLALGPDATQIEAAGPLLPADVRPRDEQRYPAVGRLADGTLALAFLARSPGERRWRGCLGRFRTAGDRPAIDPDSVAVVADRCAPIAPAFAADGRHVAFALTERPGAVSVARVSLD